jgi:hypothetical protein
MPASTILRPTPPLPGVERQGFDAGNLLDQLPKRRLLPRHGKHARAIANAGFNNSPADPSAPADHDHVLIC